MASHKRKLADSPDDSDDDSIAPQPFAPRHLPHHSKRRRFDLTRNLSRLSLFEQAQAQAPVVEEQAVSQKSPQPTLVSDQYVTISPWSPSHPQEPSGDASMDTDGDAPIHVVAHPIIEEPTEPVIDIPEVRMRNTSSYEPEKDRIVVTDLDSSEDESETPSETFAGNDDIYSVSPAFLSRIKASLPPLKSLPPKPGSDSQALVLFRPSPWSAKDTRELELMYRARDTEKCSNDQVKSQIETPDADAMEIE